MDRKLLSQTRRRFTEALSDLRRVAGEAEAVIADETLILLGLQHPPKSRNHFFGSQFGTKTWMYDFYVDQRTRRGRLKVLFGPNESPAPVAGRDATARAMLTFLEDAPALHDYVRRLVADIQNSLAAQSERPAA